MGVFMLMGMTMKRVHMQKFVEFTKLGGIMEEVLHAIKLVIGFANEDLAIQRYEKCAENALVVALHAAKTTGWISGLFMVAMFSFNVYGCLLAGILIRYQWTNPATGQPYQIVEIVICLQAVIFSLMSSGELVPIIPAIIKGLAAGKRIFDVIEREPKIRGG